MDVRPFELIDVWRGKRYKTFEDPNNKVRRKLKFVRLGKRNEYHKEMNKKKANKSCGLKLLTPMGLLSKIHEAYVDGMTRLGGNKRIDGRIKNEAKRVAKAQPVPLMSFATDEMVDSRIVIEMYNKIVSPRLPMIN